MSLPLRSGFCGGLISTDQDRFFGAVLRGVILELQCRRELFITMFRYPWKNNRLRSSKLVIIYLAFLGALLAVGFIFLWNATDQFLTNESANDITSVKTSFYVKPVQMESDREASPTEMVYDHVNSFFTSPLFWLLIVGFGLVASNISYTYLKIDKRRSNIYDKVYEKLAAYDKNVTEKKYALLSNRSDVYKKIKDIEKDLEDTRGRSQSELDERQNELIKRRQEFDNMTDSLNKVEKEESRDAIEETRGNQLLEYDIRKLISDY